MLPARLFWLDRKLYLRFVRSSCAGTFGWQKKVTHAAFSEASPHFLASFGRSLPVCLTCFILRPPFEWIGCILSPHLHDAQDLAFYPIFLPFRSRGAPYFSHFASVRAALLARRACKIRAASTDPATENMP